jgi:flagellar biosynthesis GTPase FlhF
MIYGYGDEYIIPNHSLLDDLAEDYSHTDAGIKLKEIRANNRSMIKSKLAADCDYVEPNRKETAILFVLDAFNGKVDTTLSKVKHDNYGKLEQEIKDAFAIVNEHGMAFRNARIKNEYLNARLEELKWAVTVHQLKLEEREEQKRIKEAMREEERARKEYEKAIKEAEKEEKMLQEAMTKAKKMLEEANEEQKAKYEEQIKELELKYEEAESKNQRAISMAQQTKQGHVYVISNIGSFGEEVFKIGMTRRLEPMDRVKELGDASVPFSFDVHAMIFSDDAPSLEKELHRTFEKNQVNKVNPRKEFFNLSLKEIKNTIDKFGINTHWTMVADAQEYRESLKITN